MNEIYAGFLQMIVQPHAAAWSWAITMGEVAVGLGLIVGCLTGIAAFFGGLMNINYLFAGTVSSNPLLFVLATWLVLAWRVAGWWGIDRWLLAKLGHGGGQVSSFEPVDPHSLPRPSQVSRGPPSVTEVRLPGR